MAGLFSREARPRPAEFCCAPVASPRPPQPRLARGVLHLHRTPLFGRRRLRVDLCSVRNPSGRIFNAGLLDGPKYVIPKFGQLGGRKVSRLGDAKGTKTFAEKLFPSYGIGCLE